MTWRLQSDPYCACRANHLSFGVTSICSHLSDLYASLIRLQPLWYTSLLHFCDYKQYVASPTMDEAIMKGLVRLWSPCLLLPPFLLKWYEPTLINVDRCGWVCSRKALRGGRRGDDPLLCRWMCVGRKKGRELSHTMSCFFACGVALTNHILNLQMPLSKSQFSVCFYFLVWVSLWERGMMPDKALKQGPKRKKRSLTVLKILFVLCSQGEKHVTSAWEEKD